MSAGGTRCCRRARTAVDGEVCADVDGRDALLSAGRYAAPLDVLAVRGDVEEARAALVRRQRHEADADADAIERRALLGPVHRAAELGAARGGAGVGVSPLLQLALVGVAEGRRGALAAGEGERDGEGRVGALVLTASRRPLVSPPVKVSVMVKVE